MKLLDLSGASTKFACHAAASKAIYDLGFRADVIVGVSSGAIASVPIALGMYDAMKQYSTNVKTKDFFDRSPMNKEGKIDIANALWRIARGKNSLGMQNVSKLLRQVVTERLFEEYKIGNLYPSCFALAINSDTGKHRFFDLKDLDYSTYLKVMEATSAIPFATAPVEIEGDRYFDGGVLNHIGGVEFLQKYNEIFKFTQVVTNFSRPQELGNLSRGWAKDIFGVADRMWKLNLFDKSKDDEQKQVEYCKNNNISLKQMFMPKVLDGLYDTDSERLKMLYDMSYQEAVKQFLK